MNYCLKTLYSFCQAEPLSGKVEKIYAWRWTVLPRPSSQSEGDPMEEGDDSAMAVGGSPTKTPSKASTYSFREFFVKWVGLSHWKNSWIAEIRVRLYGIIIIMLVH